jgi:hypothetical protein
MKKTSLFLVLFLFLVQCQTRNSLKFDAFPLVIPEQNSLMAKWEKKPVLDSLLLDNMEQERGWRVTGIGEMSYTTDRSRDGKQSLRFRTSLRDTAHYRQYRSDWNSFNGLQGGSSSVEINFDKPQDWSAFNRLSVWIYVHPTSMPTYCIYLYILQPDSDVGDIMLNPNNLSLAPIPRAEHFVQDLKPGMWNHVLFEIPHLKRDKVTRFSIIQDLRGMNPEEEGIVTYDIDKLELQRVVTDQYEGWNVSPEKFSFNNIGYRPLDSKIALVGSGGGNNFQLINQHDSVVYSGNTGVIENKNGVFHQLDFSAYQKTGIYKIRCGSLQSNPFPINEDIWIQPVFKAINFYFCERCGYSVPGVHLECHKDWQGFRGDVKKIINGGWHDAGDLSQGYWRTAMASFAMIRNLEVLQDRKDVSDLSDRMLSEIAWGLDWLLKVRFGDGFHMSWSTMRIYTDNIVGTIDDVVASARNVPWENFLGAAVECKAARLLAKSHPDLAGKARIAAIEDWKAGVASRDKWDQATYQEAAWGVTSSILLCEMTGEEKYKEQAILFGDLLMKCQEQNFVDGIPITGYFYTNTNHLRVIHNSHTSFEEAPMIAMAMLCREFPENENWINWYSSAVLYSEFFMKPGSQIAAPYNMLPNSVWKKEEIMANGNEKIREAMLRQFNDGTPLNKEYVLRTFPIYNNGGPHGNTNIQMSETWALAEASGLRNDTEGMQLVGKQLQWVLGANPFGQSLMYGVGYDFAPQFAYCLKDIVGSLPVGVDCMAGDKPFWSGSNYATHKEIWVEPVSRFLGAVSIYASQDQHNSSKQETGQNLQIQTKAVQSDKGVVTISITMTGTGTHEIEIKAFNSKVSFDKKQIDLSGNKTEKIELELNVTDLNKPYIATISVDKNQALRKEIVGSYINASFLADK